MFGLGFSEIVVIVVVALLVLGPRKLPEVARQLGKIMRDFRRAAADFQTTLDEETRLPTADDQPYLAADPLKRPRPESRASQGSDKVHPTPKDPAG